MSNSKPTVRRESFVDCVDYRYRIYEYDDGMIAVEYQEYIDREWVVVSDGRRLAGCKSDMIVVAEELLKYAKEMPK